MEHKYTGRALGKLAPVNKKSIALGDFLTVMPTVPEVYLAPNYTWPMFGNDVAGDCVSACEGHREQVVTGLLTPNQHVASMDEIWKFYQTQNPNFNPNGTASTNGPGSSADNGMDIQTSLEYLITQGKIKAFGHISWQSEAELKAAIYVGLGVTIGVQLQEDQMGAQFDNGLWEYVPGSPSVGGHCIFLAGYDKNYWYAVSWGKLIKLSKQFMSQLCDEAWLPIGQEHLDNPTFHNFINLAALAQAINQITEGKVVIQVPPTPTPVPNPTPMPPTPIPVTDPSTALYNAAKASLGKRMTLNSVVPAELGCAEAVSAVLKLIGVNTGPKGIAGTAALYKWLKADKRFTQVLTPQKGCIIVSPTGYGNGRVQGHTGIFGASGVQFAGDWGILSNNSSNGLFQEQWSWERWIAYYKRVGGLPIYIFKLNTLSSMNPNEPIIGFNEPTTSPTMLTAGTAGIIASLIILAASHFGYNLPYDQVINLISAASATISVIITLTGAIHKPVTSALKRISRS